ncbi:MAG: SpoIID/LytB domain-containing protein [Clostridiales bacterium]|nr:SpoIID/LytB domain-containing protein [Clostridiales bacterium]
MTIPARSIKAFLCFALCLALLSEGAYNRTEGAAIPQGEVVVRVALGLGQKEAVLTVSQGAYGISDPDSGVEAGRLSPGERITASPSGIGLVISGDGGYPGASGSRILLAPMDAGHGVVTYGARSYRGAIVVENKNGLLNVINILDVDLYLLGVLPMEMGLSTAPAEALKAQAVVSRTYALKKKNPAASYDLVSGSSDQLYGGFGSEKEHTTAAVEATAGQGIYYDGRLIEAFFSSNSGGYTEDAENVWNESLPYAKAVASPYDAFALEAAQDANGYPGNTYSWQVRYTISELQSMIGKWNQDNPSSPINIGSLQSLSAHAFAFDPATRRVTDQANESGRITRLDLAGSGGAYSLYREGVRSFLGLRSAMFTLIPEGGIAVRNGAGAVVMLGQGIAESKGITAGGQAEDINPGGNSFFIATADGVVEMSKNDAGTVTAYVFDGKGYGHGVGLSQWGAIGMAQAGMTYGQIIEYYYNQNKNDGRLAVMAVQ